MCFIQIIPESEHNLHFITFIPSVFIEGSVKELGLNVK